MKYSVVLTEEINESLLNHLIREDRQEDLCFALYNKSEGKSRVTGVLTEVVLPEDGERQVHGNASFNSDYFERVLKIAMKKNCGIVFMHSHPYSGWQHMSETDVEAEKNRMSSQVLSVTGKPLLGMTVGTDGIWSARFWTKNEEGFYEREWCETVRIVGDKLRVHFNDDLLPPPSYKEELNRTISAWGEGIQADLTRLKIGIVGVGSVGSILAECLGRMGVKNISLIDFDSFERKNIDRSIGAFENDIGKSKSDVISRSIAKGATASKFVGQSIEFSICEEEGFKNALDCDVLFSGVDRPWPRFVMNFIAYGHVIPVIDGGIRVETGRNGSLIRADWRAHTAGIGRPCLECLGQYSADEVSLEQEGLLDDPNYIKNNKEDIKKLVAGENVIAFSVSLAGLELQQFLSLLINPCGITSSPKIYHFVTGSIENDFKECEENCFTKYYMLKGDNSGIDIITKHTMAEDQRKSRKKHS